MATVGWSANPYIALVDPRQRYQGPSDFSKQMWTGGLASQNNPVERTGFEGLPSTPPPPAPEYTGGEGQGRGDISQEGGYSGMTGPMGEQDMAALGNVSKGLRGASVAAGMLGAAVPASMLSMAATPFGFLSMANLATKLAGVQPGWANVAPDFQSIRDYQGMLAAQQAQADWEGKMSNINALDTARTSLDEAQGVGTGGWGIGGGYSPDPDPDANPSGMSLGDAMGIVGGGYGDGMGDSGGRSETGGQGESGNAGMWAKGGVSRARPGFEKLAKYGEAGPEKAIFIPDEMKKKGKFGREKQVKKALKSSLKSLKG